MLVINRSIFVLDAWRVFVVFDTGTLSVMAIKLCYQLGRLIILLNGVDKVQVGLDTSVCGPDDIAKS